MQKRDVVWGAVDAIFGGLPPCSVDCDDGGSCAVRESSYELVTIARKLAEATGREVKSLVIGSGVGDVAKEFASKGNGSVSISTLSMFKECFSRKPPIRSGAISTPRTSYRGITS